MVVTVVGHLWKQLVELDGKDPDPVHQEIKKEPVTESVAVNNRWTLRRVLRQNTVNMHKKIHVFCRVRPTLDTEAGKGILHFNFPEDGNRVLEMDNLSVSGVRKSISEKQKSRKKYRFAFDKVFPPSTDQCHIFAQILPYIEFVFEGSSACIFACGHVGTGKTYTMGGDGTTHSNSVGLIPRAIKKMFEWEKKMTDYGDLAWNKILSFSEFEFEFSYLEIYNEIIRDLLGNSDNLKIINRPRKQNIEVSNLKIFPIKSWLQARHLLHKSHRNRSVGEACFNGRRSLGHGIVQINMKAIHTDGEIRIGCLKLVDLAGNECVKKFGSEGKQLLEVKFINRSISNLVTVFTAIANKHRHIPYRNSKLTYLLRNSLRGSDKVLMFMNILPDADNLSSICRIGVQLQ